MCCVGVIGPLNSEVRELPGWSHELVMELGYSGNGDGARGKEGGGAGGGGDGR